MCVCPRTRACVCSQIVVFSDKDHWGEAGAGAAATDAAPCPLTTRLPGHWQQDVAELVRGAFARINDAYTEQVLALKNEQHAAGKQAMHEARDLVANMFD